MFFPLELLWGNVYTDVVSETFQKKPTKKTTKKTPLRSWQPDNFAYVC